MRILFFCSLLYIVVVDFIALLLYRPLVRLSLCCQRICHQDRVISFAVLRLLLSAALHRAIHEKKLPFSCLFPDCRLAR